jgi:DNA helicase-2/ATP-dependent DNA helicase PcrA
LAYEKQVRVSGADLKICAKRKTLLETAGHLLILGGPGSGKTTIALVKAATELSARTLAPSQKILFLSFARATIARVMEQAKLRIPREIQHLLEINTYHGFAWNFIRTFGYLDHCPLQRSECCFRWLASPR